MKPCPEPDVLVAVAAAVEWDEGALGHVLDCPACRECRRVLRVTREALSAEHFVEGLADRALESLPAWPAPARAPSLLVGALALPLAIGLTSFAAVLASAGPAAVGIGPALGTAGVLAMAAAVRELRAAAV
jgi:hypothetical protein